MKQWPVRAYLTTQKMKFYLKDLHVYWTKSLMEIFNFFAISEIIYFKMCKSYVLLWPFSSFFWGGVGGGGGGGGEFSRVTLFSPLNPHLLLVLNYLPFTLFWKENCPPSITWLTLNLVYSNLCLTLHFSSNLSAQTD